MANRMSDTVFSEYEVREMHVIFDDGDYGVIECVGKLEQEADVTTLTKQCRGEDYKVRTKHTGTGTLTVSAHMPYEVYNKMFGLNVDGLLPGIVGIGKSVTLPTFAVVADVFDEDDVEKLKAWPCCTMTSGPAESTENGSDTVAEVDLEMKFTPNDGYYFGMYEVLADSETCTDEFKEQWMSAFDASMCWQAA